MHYGERELELGVVTGCFRFDTSDLMTASPCSSCTPGFHQVSTRRQNLRGLERSLNGIARLQSIPQVSYEAAFLKMRCSS